MAIPIDIGRYHPTMFCIDSATTLLMLPRHRVKRPYILHLCTDKSDESARTALPAVGTIDMAADEFYYLLNEFPLVIGIAYRPDYTLLVIYRMEAVPESDEPSTGAGFHRSLRPATMVP